MEELSFEETMKELENIVKELENGDLNLDESVKRFEKGMNLSKNANKMIEEAEKKIMILIRNEDEVTEQKFVE